MTNTRLEAGYWGMTALLLVCGCMSRQELSSYSEGSAEAQSPPGAPPAAEASDSPLSTGDAGPLSAPSEALDPNGVALDPSASIASNDDCAGDGEFTNANSTSCYLLGDTADSWRDARALCQAWGGDLAKVGSDDENDLLGEHIDEDAWLGASDFEEEGTFRWIGGEALDYVAWGDTQPNNSDGREDCMELRASANEWNDVSCMSENRALCERPMNGSDAP